MMGRKQIAVVVNGVLSACVALVLTMVHIHFVQAAIPTQLTPLVLEAERGSGEGQEKMRSNASGQRTVWLKSGQVLTLPFTLTISSNFSVRMRYSNDNFGSLEDVSVALDGQNVGQFQAQDTGDGGFGWNNFLVSEPIGTVDLQTGNHTLTVTVTNGDGNGVEIDFVELEAQSYFLYLPVVLKNYPPSAFWADNESSCTSCAEEDNVNIPLYAQQITHFRIVATHPTYDIGQDSCAADFSNCPETDAGGDQAADPCQMLLDDGLNVIKLCQDESWWLGNTMAVTVNGQTGDGHRLVWQRKIADEDSWPEVLVIYQDGNLRLKPQPPAGRADVCFGSSVIVGPAPPATRPFVEIAEISVNPSMMNLALTYRDGGAASLHLAVNREQATVSVTANYGASAPFATFRSMYVSEGNADVERIETDAGLFQLLNDDDLVCTPAWSILTGSRWFFQRAVRSKHNTSAPDILVEISD